MDNLNLPAYSYKVKSEKEKLLILDETRKKYVALTSEEWVRQHFISYLINNKSCPASLIAVETSLKYQKQDKRADIVVYDNLANPLLVVECKASNVKMTQKVFDQIAMYNLHFKAKYLAVTNGMEHFFCKMDYANKSYSFIKELPEYEELKK
ncbi:MAG: type I restriction enzyme HsdR N-terminal domain-containing protein [Flavobacteriales bacterium]|nr:type I restriction enzyme HsdR N-terminal domain-containing protein [Flavobacteriales bacterium]